ncbi:hypothetical protein GCM10008957_38240 [Deinococcus ruber]|uniref:Uncharacterized protein n=1 Tax=Deinococcus ruber TaxID=1848197 RepID=A0A918CGE0_9DEIO|nr:hypothetical protein GCM10008957_38240 [Deinococcus ruber]
MPTGQKTLLANRDLRLEYGFGRDLATKLGLLLPHVRIGAMGRGEKRLVRREDVDRLIDRAAQDGADLWELAKTHDPASLQTWMQAQRETN